MNLETENIICNKYLKKKKKNNQTTELKISIMKFLDEVYQITFELIK